MRSAALCLWMVVGLSISAAHAQDVLDDSASDSSTVSEEREESGQPSDETEREDTVEAGEPAPAEPPPPEPAPPESPEPPREALDPAAEESQAPKPILKSAPHRPIVHAKLKDNAGNLILFDLGPVQLSLYGLIGVQVAPYVGGDNLIQDGDVAEQAGFRLRYARFGLQGWAFDSVAFMVSMEAADLDARLLEAWIRYQPVDYLSVRLGAFKMPFSRFANLGAARGALSERPLSVSAIAPFRQVGATLEGQVGAGMLTYAAGVFNGLERHTNFYEGYVENPAFDGNRFNRISGAARVSVAPLGSVGKDAADLDGGAVRVSMGASVLYNHGASVRTTAWGADLHLKAHGFHMLLEYLSDLSEPTEKPESPMTIPSQMERMGLIGEFGYMLVAKHLGLSVRAEWQDDNGSVENAGDVITVTGGLAYYHYRHHFKVSVDYSHREELAGPTRDNDTLWLSAHFAL